MSGHACPKYAFVRVRVQVFRTSTCPKSCPFISGPSYDNSRTSVSVSFLYLTDSGKNGKVKIEIKVRPAMKSVNSRQSGTRYPSKDVVI